MPPRSSYSSRSSAYASNFSSGPSTTRVVHHYPAFSSYYSRPVVIYNDSYSSPFWYWLLDQPRPVRAAWYYHHQSSMDPARQAALVAADPALTEEVAQVAAVVPTPDPGYVPPGIEEPKAMLAEAPEEETATTSNAVTTPNNVAIPATGADSRSLPVVPQQMQPTRSSSIMSWLILLGGGSLVVWLVFFKRWKPAAA